MMAFAATVFHEHTPAGGRDDANTVLQETAALKWRRGNLHTHTHWSDGDDYLEMVGRWYKDRGYDFLCITDHNTIDETERWVDIAKSKGALPAFEKLQARFPENWIEERTVEDRREVKLKTFADVSRLLDEPEKFLLLRGEEISDKFEKKPIHLNATNIQEALPPLGGESVYEAMQRNVDAVIASLVHLNHPNFGWGITAEELMRVRGENFFEVYNGHPGVNNSGDAQHASTERIWDIINAFRLSELELPLMYGLGTDDGHNYHKIPSRAAEPGRAWVMVLSESLTPEALIAAMEAGRFYASTGVALEQVSIGKHRLALKVKPEPGVTYLIEFLGTRRGFDVRGEPILDASGNPLDVTQRYSAEIGQVWKSVDGTEGEYEFAGDELYVRARITSSKLHPNPSEIGDHEQAWVQPVVGPAAADH
jgi:hypothetical protein